MRQIFYGLQKPQRKLYSDGKGEHMGEGTAAADDKACYHFHVTSQQLQDNPLCVYMSNRIFSTCLTHIQESSETDQKNLEEAKHNPDYDVQIHSCN